jgi:hypothetical protein
MVVISPSNLLNSVAIFVTCTLISAACVFNLVIATFNFLIFASYLVVGDVNFRDLLIILFHSCLFPLIFFCLHFSD